MKSFSNLCCVLLFISCQDRIWKKNAIAMELPQPILFKIGNIIQGGVVVS